MVAKRVRTETGIAHGHVSVSSVAVDYVRQVFDPFADKHVLVIGAGKMGGLTLRHLQALGTAGSVSPTAVPKRPGNRGRVRRTGRAVGAARRRIGPCRHCVEYHRGGRADRDPETVRAILERRGTTPLVIIDIAVPRDFDPAIHDGERVCLFNIDDLQQVRDQTLAERRKHVGTCETIAQQETQRFTQERSRRRTGPVIARLTADLEAKRQIVLAQLMTKLNGRLTDDDKKTIEGAFRLLQNQFLHGPISALGEESKTGGGAALLEAIRQLFRIRE